MHFLNIVSTADTITDVPGFPPLPTPTQPLSPPFPQAITPLWSVSVAYAYVFSGHSLHLPSSTAPLPPLFAHALQNFSKSGILGHRACTSLISLVISELHAKMAASTHAPTGHI